MRKFISKLLGFDRYDFKSVAIRRKVIEDIVDFARENHPREFIMFIEGNVRKKTLEMTGLIFQEYYADEESAMPMIRLPMTMNIYGSVHSHPGASNRPSDADLHFFSKHGMVHLIIKQPYSEKDIAAYDKNGRKIEFSVIQ